VVAHWAAGGQLPPLPWLVGVAGLVAGATAWVLRRQARVVLMAPVLIVCQLGLHMLFASLGPAGHASHQAHQAVDLSPRMLAAHLACAVLTAVVWWVRRSVVELMLRLARPLVTATRGTTTPAMTRTQTSTPVWLVSARGRAPPRVLAPT
jgi:hypothetical protein